MMCLLAIAVLLMAQTPNVDTTRGPMKTTAMSYQETVPSEYSVNLTAQRNGEVRIQLKRLKAGCADGSNDACWERHQQSKLIPPAQADDLFRPVDIGRWRYFTTQIDAAPSMGSFELAATSSTGTSRKSGNIYDAKANTAIAEIRNEVLALVEQWFPRHDTADKKH